MDAQLASLSLEFRYVFAQDERHVLSAVVPKEAHLKRGNIRNRPSHATLRSHKEEEARRGGVGLLRSHQGAAAG